MCLFLCIPALDQCIEPHKQGQEEGVRASRVADLCTTPAAWRLWSPFAMSNAISRPPRHQKALPCAELSRCRKSPPWQAIWRNKR